MWWNLAITDFLLQYLLSANSVCISYFYFVYCIISVCCLFVLFTVYVLLYITVLLSVGVMKDDDCLREFD